MDVFGRTLVQKIIVKFLDMKLILCGNQKPFENVRVFCKTKSGLDVTGGGE